MRPDRQAQDWNERAQLDPYWAILTAPEKRFGGWDSDEFLAIGTDEVAGMMERFERLGHPAQHERALDFGCGVGRIMRALARQFEEAVGVDISEDMVRRAQELNADVPGASFVVTSPAISPASTMSPSIWCSRRSCSSTSRTGPRSSATSPSSAAWSARAGWSCSSCRATSPPSTGRSGGGATRVCGGSECPPRRERWLLRFYEPKFKMFELSLVPSTLKGKVLTPFRRSTRR